MFRYEVVWSGMSRQMAGILRWNSISKDGGKMFGR